MTETDENNDIGPESGELIDRLNALAERIERQRYPGSAWRAAAGPAAVGRAGARQGIRRIFRPRLAAAAAAVVAAAVILLATYSHGPAPVASNGTAQPVRVALAPSPAQAPQPAASGHHAPEWNVPTDINLVPGAGEVRVPSADITMPSDLALAVPGQFEWRMATISFPSLR